MKKTVALMIMSMLGFTAISAQEHIQLIDTTKYYAFSINYWFNMHHLLATETYHNIKSDSTVITVALPDVNHEALNKALQFYRNQLADEDLRTSQYMSDFKKWITSTNSIPTSAPQEFDAHMQALIDFDNTYRQFFWPKHQAACQQALSNHIDMIRNTEEEFVNRITTLTRQYWQFAPRQIQIDLSFYGKVNSRSFVNVPYTTLFPTHVVMSTYDYDLLPGHWLELLYHESAHHLILGRSYFIAGTILDLVETANVDKVPSQLGHAYLFYFTGKLTQELLDKMGIEYPRTYMQREGVFGRYHALLEKHLPPYMNREITLSEATRRFIQEYNQQ